MVQQECVVNVLVWGWLVAVRRVDGVQGVVSDVYMGMSYVWVCCV